MSPEGVKRLRADAQRNRDSILTAAREAFAVDGLEVPLDEIARRAGVGPGTVHRHFPTKESLFEAAMLDHLRSRVEMLRELIEWEDPAAALDAFFVRMLENGTNRALWEGLSESRIQLSSDEAVHASTDFFQALADLLRKGQEAGVVRPDLTAKQVKAMLIGVLAAGNWMGGDVRERRQLAALVCDGFRTRAGNAGDSDAESV